MRSMEGEVMDLETLAVGPNRCRRRRQTRASTNPCSWPREKASARTDACPWPPVGDPRHDRTCDGCLTPTLSGGWRGCGRSPRRAVRPPSAAACSWAVHDSLTLDGHHQFTPGLLDLDHNLPAVHASTRCLARLLSSGMSLLAEAAGVGALRLRRGRALTLTDQPGSLDPASNERTLCDFRWRRRTRDSLSGMRALGVDASLCARCQANKAVTLSIPA